VPAGFDPDSGAFFTRFFKNSSAKRVLFAAAKRTNRTILAVYMPVSKTTQEVKQMDKQKRIWTVGWIVVGVVALGMVGAFAIVENSSTESKSVGTGLDDVIEARRTWNVAFAEWSGKEAPDFTVSDIEGVRHRLSDYRGRDVLVVFWATWCPACKMEIPHLNELRETFEEGELAILAISNETAEDLKQFATSASIDYSVVSLGAAGLSSPFADVRSIPTTFFIDRDGLIKLAAEGLVSADESKAILRAGR
jgi:peroxiredoxin